MISARRILSIAKASPSFGNLSTSAGLLVCWNASAPRLRPSRNPSALCAWPALPPPSANLLAPRSIPVEQEKLEKSLESARQELPTAPARTAWLEGWVMPVEQAHRGFIETRRNSAPALIFNSQKLHCLRKISESASDCWRFRDAFIPRCSGQSAFSRPICDSRESLPALHALVLHFRLEPDTRSKSCRPLRSSAAIESPAPFPLITSTDFCDIACNSASVRFPAPGISRSITNFGMC